MIEYHLDTSAAAPDEQEFAVSVIGIGGAGANVIDRIALEGMPGADLICMNCDVRSLTTSMAGRKVQLGRNLTQGLGCGGDPELGMEAAMSSSQEIRELLTGRSMVFLSVGLGGGTGSGAAPYVARLAREAGAFVVVFATLPFGFEGKRRMTQALGALQELRQHANALVTFENDRMGEMIVPKKGVQEAFETADRLIGQSVRAVTSLVTQPGLIRIGMDDLITALRNTDSRCLFGFGQAKGENRAVEALGLALKSPLLDRGQMLSSARNVLVHICGGINLRLYEIETLMGELSRHVSEDAQILFGAATDSRLNEHLSVTIITSLSKAGPVQPEARDELPAARDNNAEFLEALQPRKAEPAAAAVGAAAEPELFEDPQEAAPTDRAPAEPVAEEPVAEEPVAEEAVVEEPVAEEPAATQQATEVPAPAAGDDEFDPEVEYADDAEYTDEVPADAEPEAGFDDADADDFDDEPVAGELEPDPEDDEAIETVETARPEPEPKRQVRLSEVVESVVPRRPDSEPARPVAEDDTRTAPHQSPPRRPAQPQPQARTPQPPPSRTPGHQHLPAQHPQPQQPRRTAQRPQRQETFDERLVPPANSRFNGVPPTVEEGEDLDVPTFLRKKP